MVTYTTTPHEQERINAVRANMGRLNMTAEALGEHFRKTSGHVLDVLKGRYGSETTDTWLTQYEHYLSTLLGVRYIQPYFNDIEVK